MASNLNSDGAGEDFTGFEEEPMAVSESATGEGKKNNDADHEMDSDSGNLVIAEPQKQEPKSSEKSPRKRRTRSSVEDSTPTRTPSTRVKGRGMAYLIAMEKGGGKKRMAQAHAQAEAQETTTTISPGKQEPSTSHEPNTPKEKELEKEEEKSKEVATNSPAVANSPALTPATRPRSGKREFRKSYGAANISSPLLKEPFKEGWRREVVYRATVDPGTKTLCDVYYYTPDGKKLRSGREVAEYLDKADSPFTVENFTFFKEPIGMDSSKEILRYAKQRRDDAGGGPAGGDKNITKKERALRAREEELRRNLQELGEDVAAITGQAPAEGVPSADRGEQPESTSPSRRKKGKADKQIKVKLWGSKGLKSKENAEPFRKEEEEEVIEEKKVSPTRALPEDIQHLFSPHVQGKSAVRSSGRGLGRTAPQGLETVNGKRFVSIGNAESVRSPAPAVESSDASYPQPVKRPLQSPDQPSPRSSPKRMKPPIMPSGFSFFAADQFVNFMSNAYQGLLQVFRYLTVQELMAAAGVCRLWRDLALHHSHWRVVRLKNSRIYDWISFSSHLRRAGTQYLDMRKMLFVTSREETWENIKKAASHLSEIQRIDFCKCPVELIETIALHCPRLQYIDATSISSPSIKMEMLSGLSQLQELKIRATSGLSLQDGLRSFANLKQLKSLNLTTLSDLKSSDLEHLIDLPSLESLDIGDCVGWTEESDYRVLGRLSHLHHLRLEQGPPEHCVLNHLTSLNLPSNFSHLELINFTMNMPMEQFNLPLLKRLLLIPHYSEETLADTVKYVFKALSSMKNLQQINWVVTDEILNTVANCKLPFVSETSPTERAVTLDELQELLRQELTNTNVKIVRLPQYATVRYSLSSNQED